VAESFFATLKKELVHRRSWPTRRELIGERLGPQARTCPENRVHSIAEILSFWC
jgi:hypothetical protein